MGNRIGPFYWPLGFGSHVIVVRCSITEGSGFMTPYSLADISSSRDYFPQLSML